MIEFQSNMPGILEALQAKATERAEVAGQLVNDHIRAQMEAPKSGEVYTAAPGVTYVAAAAGEYPAVRTGGLIGSLGVLTQDGAAVVGASAPYAAEVEQVRPFLSRAAVELDQQLQQVASEGWE